MGKYKFNRIITVVMDSVGAGAAHDAEKYGDAGSDTLGHIGEAVGGLNLPYLQNLGLGNLHPIKGVDPVEKPHGYYTKLVETSAGKDTMTGHWELMGLFIDEPFITFTETGFPQDLLDELSSRTGYGIIGNKAASGTEILDELGEEHMATKKMIVYTSADSVLQIAAHEEVFGLDELYRACEIARELTMKPEWKVGRVIARPFIGDKKGAFTRTSNRHDYALKPFGKTELDHLKDAGLDVISVGKIIDIFDGEGITDYHRSKSNFHGMEQTIDIVKNTDFTGLMFVNLVDFDALWGHRRNPEGYAKQLEEFDGQLAELLASLRNDDLLIITADHGNDPTHPGTDHTREEVPVLYYSPSFTHFGPLKDKGFFADIAQTIADNFNTAKPEYGTSVLDELI
ncbi:phosphopentomutase [Erysipelothrix larvae]|uniref:Phosphopentomutase n=1 Tax=Erysipelothrix larvae TaxID=1514105 RepID=A0A0X8GZK9_9FIRM|nr:phosphopentomutase [Erysipelothrix larvae]AMC93338.1 phosphopentomutase [Erysipelothrix larvae]